MRRAVLTYGILSGGLAALMTFGTIPLVGQVSYTYLTVLGYTIFFASFLMVYFGIRSYRDTEGGGTVTFGKAFTVGILITLLSCAIYAVSWDALHQRFLPTFFDDYLNHLVETMRVEGATEEALNRQMQENEQFREWFRSRLIRYAMSLVETFPVGLLMTLVSALALKTKAPTGRPA